MRRIFISMTQPKDRISLPEIWAQLLNPGKVLRIDVGADESHTVERDR